MAARPRAATEAGRSGGINRQTTRWRAEANTKDKTTPFGLRARQNREAIY